MKKGILVFLVQDFFLDKAQIFEKKSSASYLSIEGTWKFHFIKDYNKRPVTCNKLEVIRQE